MSEAIAVVVVTHDSALEIEDLLTTLRSALDPGDEVVFVDNASSDTTVARLRAAGVRVLEQHRNAGFGSGCRAGAQATSSPLLLFLNPDTRIDAQALARLRAVADERPSWGAWQPAVMLPDGRINTSGGVVHFLGFGWAGQCGEPACGLRVDLHEIAFASGAALVIRRAAWDALGGFEDSYFLYGEDLDLGLRLWLAGYAVGIDPRARVTHRYDFDKGPRKWYLLERNRWLTLIADYPGALLIALAPALVAAELGLLVIAARDGWLRAKLRANASVLVALPRALRRRRAVQSARTIGARAFVRRLGDALENPNLGELPALLGAGQRAYFALVRLVL